MSRFLLDTNVLSEFAPGRQGLPRPWRFALEQPVGQMFVSAMSLVEIEEGICKLERNSQRLRADALRSWLGQVLDWFDVNVIEFNADLAIRMGRLSDEARSVGRHPGLADLAIAATAEAGALILLTRNLRHFEPLGVAALDPFLSPPP